MFYGNHDAAENAAIMYSFLGSCIAIDVNPREWLTDVLTRIPKNNRNYDLDLADLYLTTGGNRKKPNKIQLKSTKLRKSLELF